VSIVIAVAALLFTVGSFWWLNRRGRLVGAAPDAYAIANPPHDLLIRFPLAIFNTGATRHRGRGRR
jgi:hypothetical protein